MTRKTLDCFHCGHEQAFVYKGKVRTRTEYLDKYECEGCGRHEYFRARKARDAFERKGGVEVW